MLSSDYLRQAVEKEESKWKDKPYIEIAELVRRPAVYQTVYNGRKYSFEINANALPDGDGIVVMVEGSRFPIPFCGFAKYFVSYSRNGTRPAAANEVF